MLGGVPKPRSTAPSALSRSWKTAATTKIVGSAKRHSTRNGEKKPESYGMLLKN